MRIKVRILDPDVYSKLQGGYSAESNGRISMKFYEWIACESRKTAFNFGSDTDNIRDAVSVSGFYPDY